MAICPWRPCVICFTTGLSRFLSYPWTVHKLKSLYPFFTFTHESLFLREKTALIKKLLKILYKENFIISNGKKIILITEEILIITTKSFQKDKYKILLNKNELEWFYWKK